MQSKTAEKVFDTSTLVHPTDEKNYVVEKTVGPLNVFYSYAHKDEEFRVGLDNHLQLLQRTGLISAWHDRKIGAGNEWEKQIDLHLHSADIVLLLVSANF